MKDRILKIKQREQNLSSSDFIIRKKRSQEKFEGLDKLLLSKLSHTLILLARYDKGE